MGFWMPLSLWKQRITCNMQNVLNWLGNVQISQPSLVEIMFPKKKYNKFPHPIHDTNLYLQKNRSFIIIIIYLKRLART